MDTQFKWISRAAAGLFVAVAFLAALMTPDIAMADSSGIASSSSTKGWSTNASGETVYVDSVVDGNAVYRTGWLVSDARGQGQQRYWFNSDGTLAADELIDAGNGCYAYARPEGYVVRGRYVHPDTGYVYLANNDGRLEKTGWTVSNSYGQGLQRYWVDADTHATIPGYSSSGYAHYTTSEGYVVRGKHDNGFGRVYLADNDGKLIDGSGWVVTGAFDGGVLQRYYIDSSDHAARSGYFHDTDGKMYFGLGGRGYVLRGVGRGAYGETLFADNDGVLAVSRWVVADAFGQGLQRYWFDADGAMAKGRLIDPDKEASGYWAYATDEGSILRGISIENNVKRVADNDGKIANGWLVTGVFTNGALERYWQESGQIVADQLVRVGNGTWAYASSSGAVARGRYAIGDKIYFANNDGVLENAGWLVSSSYGHGLQRYYIDPDEHAAIVGFSDADYAHYTTSDGYVLRGKLQTNNGLLIADNDGALVENSHSEGWLITNNYDGGAQRYYFKNVDGHLYALVGFFQMALEFDPALKWFYADPSNGYVTRGKASHSSGVLIADNDGALIENDHGAGWCITKDYDGEPQRYYLVQANGHLFAKTGIFSAELTAGSGERLFYGFEDAGYVARNTTVISNDFVYSADNDGALTQMSYVSRTRDGTLAQVTWSNDYGYLEEVKGLAAQYGSATNWFIAVDDKLCRVVVLHRSGDSWSVDKTWNCNGGRKAYQWIGDHTIVHRKICNWADEYFGKGYNDWSTCFIESYSSNSEGHLRPVGNGLYEDCASFHSTGYTWTGWDNAGCIGLLWDNAKWIYDTIPDGTNMCLFNPRV